jgi:UDP-glucose-4-epimerase GalE
MSKTVLITGAAGYIGSHFIEAFYETAPRVFQGATLVFVDDLSSGHESTLQVLKEIAQAKGYPMPEFCKIDILDEAKLLEVFQKSKPDAVVHFAAKISVAESVEKPDYYFENNVTGSLTLLKTMKEVGCKRMVFSSTAAVYGKVEDPKKANRPLTEDTPLLPVNPYGKTKLMMEEAIQKAGVDWGLNSVIFRYFNAAGASLSGKLGECHEPETHLIPLLVRASIAGKPVSVFGTQYNTRDGSCVRDYIHVADLASAHLHGLEILFGDTAEGSQVFNLGTERGNTVLEVVDAAEVLTGKTIHRDLKPARPGDSAVLIADSTKARTELMWKPKHSSLHEILKTVFAWEKKRS